MGVALATGAALVGVCSLEALLERAGEASEEDATVGVLASVPGGVLLAARDRAGARVPPTCLRVGEVAALLASHAIARPRFVGEAAEALREHFPGAPLLVDAPLHLPTAASVGRLALAGRGDASLAPRYEAPFHSRQVTRQKGEEVSRLATHLSPRAPRRALRRARAEIWKACR